MLRNLLRLLRTREIRKARSIMKRDEVRDALKRVAPLIREDELKAAVAPVLSPGLLRRILVVELSLSGIGFGIIAVLAVTVFVGAVGTSALAGLAMRSLLRSRRT